MEIQILVNANQYALMALTIQQIQIHFFAL